MSESSRIYVIGSLNADLVQKVPRLPKGGETLQGNDLRTFAGGKGGNQAFAAARMGGRVSMVGQVGSDGFGVILLDSLRSAGVNTDHVAVVEGSSGTAMILVLPNGENAIVISSGANATLTPGEAARSLEHLATGSLLLCQLEIPIETVERALAVAKRKGATTILDPAPANTACLAMLPHVDFLTPNETEAMQLLGLDGAIDGDDQALQVASKLRDEGASTVVLKLGSRGCCIVNKEISTIVSGHEVTAVDTTAAGDTFNGAFACALDQKRSIVEAARFANAAGALSVTRPGAQNSVPTRKEVEQFLGRMTAPSLR
ncbi:MAG: ribokinase [Bryobacterales bacterium]